MNVIIDKGGYIPERAYGADAGLDIKSPIDCIVPARGSKVIPTKVHCEIPFGCAGFLKSKSGLNVNYSILSDGTIDSGYTGEILCKLYNLSDTDYHVHVGDKITQMVIQKICLFDCNIVDDFPETDRGENGFGSTGK